MRMENTEYKKSLYDYDDDDDDDEIKQNAFTLNCEEVMDSIEGEIALQPTLASNTHYILFGFGQYYSFDKCLYTDENDNTRIKVRYTHF